MRRQDSTPEAFDEARMGGESDRAMAQAPRRIPIVPIALAIVAIIAIVFFGRICSQAASIDVTVNGKPYTLRGDKTMEVAIKVSGVPVNPGDLISLKGTVLKRDAGNPFYAKVNDAETSDPAYQLHQGDQITLTDGTDIVEEYDAVESPVPYGMSIIGLGAIHTFAKGTDGVMETRTGRLSGDVVEKQTVDPIDASETRFDPDPGDAKIVALTFDDGPSRVYTQDILDILAENDAKATFFCRGLAVENNGTELVRAERDAGHQVCSHSYNNAAAANGEMSNLTPDEQREQVQKSFEILAEALGYQPSRLVRMGSSDMTDWVALNVFDLIDGEIGWTIDTGDWVAMPEEEIYDVLMSVKPGSIVRMHDGGAEQDETVSALKRALPALKKKGFEFVTIDELLERSTPANRNTSGKADAEDSDEAESERSADEAGSSSAAAESGDSAAASESASPAAASSGEDSADGADSDSSPAAGTTP